MTITCFLNGWKLKWTDPMALMYAVCLCAGLPSMHSATAQLDNPRCQAAVVAYRTPDNLVLAKTRFPWGLLPSFRLQRVQRVSFPTFTTPCRKTRNDCLGAVNKQAVIVFQYIYGRQKLFFFLLLVWYLVFVGNWKVCSHVVGQRDKKIWSWVTVCNTEENKQR